MKKVYLILLLSVLIHMPFNACFSQGFNNIWITGFNIHSPLPWGNTVFNFSSGSPSLVAQNMNLNFRRTNASISDSNGNLLFYTNGFTVCNALGDTMPNGAGLDSSSVYTFWYAAGMPSPQAALIIPFPSNPDSFYLFHQTTYNVQWPNVTTYAPLELYYSIIDMTLDSGRGDIIEKQTTLFQDTIQNGRLTACKHANGRDWWVVTRKAYSDLFYTFLVSPNGIQAPLVQQIGDVLFPPDIGHVCFSQQGDKYALVDHFNHLRIYDFDRCNGSFSNPLYIPILDSSIARGVAFSPSGQFIYVTSERFVYQYDCWSTNIDSSRITVAVWDSTYSPQPPSATTFYSAQLGPDNKIYIVASNGVQVMHVINYPDSVGLSCDVCQHCLALPTYNSFGCIPNIPNYFLGAETGSVCDSIVTDAIAVKSDLENFKAYPNPTTNSFGINYDLSNQDSDGELILMNSLGNIVQRKRLYKHSKSAEIECSYLPPGVYILSVVSNEKVLGRGKISIIK